MLISWQHFPYFAIPSVLLWALGAYYSFREKKTLTATFTLLGIALFFAFICGLWISLERPPLRTMGETRLWYSFFLPVAGIITWSRWRYRWILSFSTILALVFICVNLFKPEIHNTTLMPALQSPWFAPHVIVYMFCYALFGAALAVALYLLFVKTKRDDENIWNMLDNLEYLEHARQPRLCGSFVHDHRHALRRSLGQGGLGTLLGMGPQGDLGRHHLALLPCLYPLSAIIAQCLPQQNGHLHSYHQFLLPADVLVGHQLPAIGTRQERSHL